MINVSGAINNTVSFSQFNKGQAGKIFQDVRKNGTKVVLKNNKAECVLMSPEEYSDLMELLNDYRLEAIAAERMKNFSPEDIISQEDVLRELNIQPEELAAMDEVEIE